VISQGETFEESLANLREAVLRDEPAPVRDQVAGGDVRSISLLVNGRILTLHPRGDFKVEVVAGALTLFSAIQASRVEHPDRSTLRGLLGAAGTGCASASDGVRRFRIPAAPLLAGVSAAGRRPVLCRVRRAG
jgi:hypothetical protein